MPIIRIPPNDLTAFDRVLLVIPLKAFPEVIRSFGTLDLGQMMHFHAVELSGFLPEHS